MLGEKMNVKQIISLGVSLLGVILTIYALHAMGRKDGRGRDAKTSGPIRYRGNGTPDWRDRFSNWRRILRLSFSKALEKIEVALEFLFPLSGLPIREEAVCQLD
jgi:hypothetical protein